MIQLFLKDGRLPSDSLMGQLLAQYPAACKGEFQSKNIQVTKYSMLMESIKEEPYIKERQSPPAKTAEASPLKRIFSKIYVCDRITSTPKSSSSQTPKSHIEIGRLLISQEICQEFYFIFTCFNGNAHTLQR